MLKELIRIADQQEVTLIAVSKTFPPDMIRRVYDLGVRDFGENKVQELLEKQALLPTDIRWHLIGHLQTNKVKQVASFIHMIHSVDSEKLLLEINRQGARLNRKIACLLQFHIAREETKYGFDIEQAVDLLKRTQQGDLPFISFSGVMGMATFSTDRTLIRAEFTALREIFIMLKSAFFADQPTFREVSMGMSGDWELALEEGSTMLRIGSLIFGDRT